MIKKMLIVIFLIFLVPTALAEISPRYIAMEFCEAQGFVVEQGNEIPDENYNFYDLCVFDNGNKCNTYEFQSGECGEEHKKELSCAKEGESPRFRGCCFGLYSPPIIGPPAACEKVGFFQSIINWLFSIL